MSEKSDSQKILVPFWGKVIPEKALATARLLANGFEKSVVGCAMAGQIGVLCDADVLIYSALESGHDRDKIDEIVRRTDAIMVILSDEEGVTIKRQLRMCRNLRIPFLFVPKSGVSLTDIKKILVPVGFLVEEKEKGPWANSFGRFFGSDIILMKPNDKGTKAYKNLLFLQRLLKGYKQGYTVREGRKNSFGIEKEAVSVALAVQAELVFIMASREYGLDDLFFGPKEYHVLKRAKLPVMVLNPRDDIYVLCGN